MDIKPKFGFHTLLAVNYVWKIRLVIIACYSKHYPPIASWSSDHEWANIVFCITVAHNLAYTCWVGAMLSFSRIMQQNSSTMTKFPHPGSTVATCTMSPGRSAPALLYLETVCPDWARQQSQQLHTTVLSGIKNEAPSWNAQECLHLKGRMETAIMQGKRE